MAYITIFIKVYLLIKIKIKRFLNFELDSQITNDYPYFVETHVPQMQFNLEKLIDYQPHFLLDLTDSLLLWGFQNWKALIELHYQKC